MALHLSKLFLRNCILYSELPYEIASLGVSSPILQKKQKNVRQLFKVSQSFNGSYSCPTILEDVVHAGVFYCKLPVYLLSLLCGNLVGTP